MTNIEELEQKYKELGAEIEKLKAEKADPYKLQDKDAVWCWDDVFTHKRDIRFWDGIHHVPFGFSGERNGVGYDHYEKILPQDEPEWVKEARKTLED